MPYPIVEPHNALGLEKMETDKSEALPSSGKQLCTASFSVCFPDKGRAWAVHFYEPLNMTPLILSADEGANKRTNILTSVRLLIWSYFAQNQRVTSLRKILVSNFVTISLVLRTDCRENSASLRILAVTSMNINRTQVIGFLGRC